MLQSTISKKLIIPKKCFGCLFKREERVSDITLGDFWGCEDIFSDTRLHSGVSLVLINSEKGARLFADKKSDKNAIVERCIDKSYLKYQGNLRQVTPPSDRVRRFLDMLQEQRVWIRG